jgi:hypothetical protein
MAKTEVTAEKKKLGAYWVPISLLEKFAKYSEDNKVPMSRIVTALISDFLDGKIKVQV